MANFSLFGFWLPVKDEQSARYAVRMAGLLALLLGASACIVALKAFVQSHLGENSIAGMAIIGFALCLIAFRLRAGRAGWVPLVTLLVLTVLCGRLAFSVLLLGADTTDALFAARILVSWVISLFCAAFSIGGVRGWLWQRRTGAKRGL